MHRKRILRAGPGPARSHIRTCGIVAALALAAVPLPASAAEVATLQPAPPLEIHRGATAITDFYRARGGRPLWLAPEAGTAARELIELLGSASADGLDPGRFRPGQLNSALRAAWGGDIRAVNRAETMLSQAFVAYAQALRKAPDVGVKYVDRELIPTAPPPRALLEEAARAPSLEAFVRDIGWMHPIYGELRRALRTGGAASETEQRTLALNLERARALPGGRGRAVIVNAAAQRLTMYENGREVGSMRVVVGKPHQATPMMAAFIRYTSLNPYWNVPPDLAAERIAPSVIKEGVGYLERLRYEVLSDWTAGASLVDPSTVDWAAVAAGRTEVRLRQLPGPKNAMGQMKFMFPNAEGVYLHDTPDKELLEEASRLFSGGCVRLEDAPRLARWLHGDDLQPQGARPEQRVPLPQPVPVYLTYLTAVPSGSQVAYFDDIYGRDSARLAQLQDGIGLATR